MCNFFVVLVNCECCSGFLFFDFAWRGSSIKRAGNIMGDAKTVQAIVTFFFHGAVY